MAFEYYYTNEDEEPRLEFAFDGKEIYHTSAENCTALELGELLDQEAENANQHDLVGAYTALAKLIIQHSNETVAKKVLHDIAVTSAGLVDFGE